MSHYYDILGNPRHFEAKNGKPTTLREARKLHLYPSVTTIGNVRAKFQLTNWLQEEAAMEATNTSHHETDGPYDRAWAKQVVAAARERTMAKADEGTEIHDILEQAILGRHVPPQWVPMVQAVDECVTAQTGVDMGLLTPEESFCDSELGYAGKCDLHGHGWVIDFKSKDADAMGKARGWPEQAEQLVAYANGLDTPNARLANVFISRSPPEDGEPWAVKWFEHNDEWAWARFLATLNLWQTVNKFGPAFEALQEQAA